MWPEVTVPGALGAWWAVSQQMPAPVFPGARLGEEWTGTSASATSCSPKSHTCLQPAPSAPPALHLLGSLPSHLRAPRMGSRWSKPPSSAELTSPKGQQDKTRGQHLCPCCVQPPFPIPDTMGLQPLLKPKGCWGCKTQDFFLPKSCPVLVAAGSMWQGCRDGGLAGQ